MYDGALSKEQLIQNVYELFSIYTKAVEDAKKKGQLSKEAELFLDKGTAYLHAYKALIEYGKVAYKWREENHGSLD